MRIHTLIAVAAAIGSASPAFAQDADGDPLETALEGDVFDGDYVIVGLGGGVIPTYEGSNDYRPIPLFGAVGEVQGIGFSLRGLSLSVDVLPDKPITPGSKVSLRLGPQIKYRSNRSGGVKDDVVALLPKLDGVVEAGGKVGIGVDELFSTADKLNLGVSARWDVSGKGSGYLITPSANYRLPLSRSFALGFQVTAQFMDGKYADYNFAIDAAGAEASGLPEYDAKGGLNNITAGIAVAYDISGDFLDGGLAIGVAAGYSRLYGSSARSPITSVRGSRDQLLFGAGIAHSF